MDIPDVPIYRQLAAERLIEVPGMAGGVDDHLVQRTFNGLREDDLALEQPSQQPAGWWTS